MQLPFSAEQFLEAFRAYNTAIGVAPALLIGLAIGLIILVYSEATWRHRAITAGLAALWAWSGAVYHWGFFVRINPAARLFGALFLLQAIILLTCVVRDRLQFAPRASLAAWAGWSLMAYALVAYPLLGIAGGHAYPDGPSFGAPCPTTIFFLGIMLWTRNKPPLSVIAIPLAWAVIGTGAAVQLGIREDFGLAVAGLLIVGNLIQRRLVPVVSPPKLVAR
jgi:hypothetical protein